MYQLGANDNEKETLIDCTSASAVFFYQIKSFVSILEDESARFFAVSKSNSNADRNRGKTGVFLGEFIVDKEELNYKKQCPLLLAAGMSAAIFLTGCQKAETQPEQATQNGRSAPSMDTAAQ